ncbi:MAG: ROK family protein [Gemmiger sp.]
MEKTGINLENVKLNNRSAILKLLNASGPMSRKDIATALGLTPATVTLISNELLAAGVLNELGEMQESPRAGRKKILLGIQYQCRSVLCISIEANDTCLTVSDLKGNAIAARTVRTASELAPEQFLKQLADESRILMWEHNIPRDSILGVGVSLPGPVDRQKGISQLAYRVWGSPVEVRRILTDLLRYPVFVSNNVKAFAEAGLIYGEGIRAENVVFLKWGPGVGCALVIQNRVYEGVHRKAAEIGHVTVDPNGRQCRCGRKGCLETVASTHAVAQSVRSICSPEKTPRLWEFAQGDPQNIKAGNIADWVVCGDGEMWRTLDNIITTLADTVGGTMTLFAPDKVVLYGEMFELPHFQEHFLRACRKYDPAYDSSIITMSSLRDKLDYIGPLAVVANEMFFSGRMVEAALRSQQDTGN